MYSICKLNTDLGLFHQKVLYIWAFIWSVVEPEPAIILGHDSGTKSSSTSKTMQVPLVFRSDRPGLGQDLQQPQLRNKVLCDDVQDGLCWEYDQRTPAWNVTPFFLGPAIT